MRLFASDSMMWHVNRERCVLLGGPAAAVLQVAHPTVALGVVKHSEFRRDTLGRLHRTLEAVYAVAFGTQDEVERVRESVAAAHHKVRGSGYSAFDPAAQLWVLATLVHGSISIFERCVRPLSVEEKEQLLRENRSFGKIFGKGGDLLPQTWPEFCRYWSQMMESPLLGSAPECGLAARAVLNPLSPWWLRALSPVLRALANEWIPMTLRRKLGLCETSFQRPFWKFIDRVSPILIPTIAPRWRFVPQYLAAQTREQKRSLSACP